MGAATISLAYLGSGRAHSFVPPDDSIISGGIQMLIGTATISGSGSDTNTAAGIAMDLSAKIPSLQMVVCAPTVGGLLPIYSVSAKKVLFYYGDYSQSSDGVLIVIPDATALPADTFKWVAFGLID